MSQILILVSLLCSFSIKASFTLSTQNLWHYTKDYNTRLSNLHNSFQEDSADIMNFQEAWESIGGKSLYNEFTKKDSFNTHYFRTNNTIVIKEGLSTISKFEFDNKKYNFKLPHSKLFRRRTMIITKVKLKSSKEVYIANVHLSPFSDKRKERDDQLEFILKTIKDQFSDLPIIIAGDFNQEESDSSFFSPLRKAGFVSSLSGQCTYCSNENPYTNSEYISKLDYIYYQPKYFEINYARRTFVNNPISDHYGIKVELTDLRDR